MALFYRANLNALSLLNHCYCKFTTGMVRLKSRDVMSSLTQNWNNKQSTKKTTHKSDVDSMTFETKLANRRDQACRSILVQVHSLNSQNDLQSYCAQYGEILSMHHYQIDKQHNYILVEFKDTISVNEVLSSASFMNEDSIAPVKSSVLWFYRAKGLASFNQKNNQKKIALSTQNGCMCPTEKEITNLLQNAKTLSGQIIMLYEALKLSDLEIRLRFHTAHHIEQYFSGLFQDMKILPFGSSINGFGRKRCDLDLVLIPADTKKYNLDSRLAFHTKFMKLSERHETKEFMAMIANIMYRFVPGVYNVRRILEARVPIIKFNYNYVHIECDLSITNMTAVYMSELLSLYGEIDWRVRPLVTTVRKWAKSQDITSDVPGHWITNFPLSLLVLFYLQQKSILPSLKTLKSCATPNDIRRSENGVDCTFLRDIRELPTEYKYKSNQESLESLLCGFFEYYSTFDFDIRGICIREGVPIPKPSRSPLHITNPLETTFNVCKNVNSYEVNHIMEKMHDAVYTLETTDKSRENWGLMSLLNNKNVSVTDIVKLHNTEEQSIEDYSNDKISDKFEVNEVDIKPKKKKKETV